MARKAAPTGDIVKLKVTLQGISPPIWRRLLIPAAMTLRDLHEVLQTSMGWHDAHLHDFDIAGERFGDPATTEEVENEARMTLDRVRKAGARPLQIQLRLRRRLGAPDRHRGHRPARRGPALPRLRRRQAGVSPGRLRRCLGLPPLARGHGRPGASRARGHVRVGE